MSKNQLTSKANLIWDKLFCIENEHLLKQDQVDLIESVLSEIADEYRMIGRSQIITHLRGELNNLSK